MNEELTRASNLVDMIDSFQGTRSACKCNVKISSLIDEETYNHILDEMAKPWPSFVPEGLDYVYYDKNGVRFGQFDFQREKIVEEARAVYKKLSINYLYPDLKLALLDGKPKVDYVVVKYCIMMYLGYRCFAGYTGGFPLKINYKKYCDYLATTQCTTPASKFATILFGSGCTTEEFKKLYELWNKNDELHNDEALEDFCRHLPLGMR